MLEAGGGSGYTVNTQAQLGATGGSGGGTNGGNGIIKYAPSYHHEWPVGGGGSQSAGGKGWDSHGVYDDKDYYWTEQYGISVFGSFGKGGNKGYARWCWPVAVGTVVDLALTTIVYALEAGGSGYVGGVQNGSMSNGVQSGNGRAVITYVGS